MSRIILLILISALLVSGALSTGCSEEQATERKLSESRDALAPQVAEEWEKATGEKVDSNRMVLATGKLSESHSVMASMILMGNSMSSDLSSYKQEISILEFRDATGVERAAVVVGSKVVLPKATSAAPETPSGEIAP